MTDREFARSVVLRLRDAGFQALWAGGCVRDELLGLTPADYDVATNARPEQIQKLFKHNVAIGAAFGVIQVIGPRVSDPELGHRFLSVEVATFRSDQGYSDGRRPDKVVYSTAEEDALRRDFTINGMFFDPLADELLDYVGGRDDLKAGVLRAIGDPKVRFTEDKLRMLRAVRIASRFEFSLDAATAESIRLMAREVSVVSAERIAEELRKLLVHPRRASAMRLLRELSMVGPILPEAAAMIGLPQGPPQAPSGDLWDHVMRVLEHLGPNVSFPLALGALLHDIGKPRTVKRTERRYTFYFHEHVGSRMAAAICRRLKLSNAERDRVVWLVERHQYLCSAKQMRTAKIKAMLAHPGIRELLDLHRADALGTGTSTEHVDYCEFLLSLWTDDDLNPPPLLTGHDLTRRGLPPGPVFKRILDAVREAQLDGVVRNSSQALALADRLAKEPEPVEETEATTADEASAGGALESDINEHAETEEPGAQATGSP